MRNAVLLRQFGRAATAVEITDDGAVLLSPGLPMAEIADALQARNPRVHLSF